MHHSDSGRDSAQTSSPPIPPPHQHAHQINSDTATLQTLTKMSIEGATTPPPQPSAPGVNLDEEPSPTQQQQQQSLQESQQLLGTQPQQQQRRPVREHRDADGAGMSDLIQDTQDNDDEHETEMEDLQPVSGDDEQSSGSSVHSAALADTDLQGTKMTIPWTRTALTEMQAGSNDIDSVNIPDNLDGNQDAQGDKDDNDNEEDDNDDEEEDDVVEEDEDEEEGVDGQDEYESEEGNTDDMAWAIGYKAGASAGAVAAAAAAATIKRGLSSSTTGSYKPTKKDSSWKSKQRSSLEPWDSGLSPEPDVTQHQRQPPPTSPPLAPAGWDDPVLPSYTQTWDEIADRHRDWGGTTGLDDDDDDNWKETLPIDDRWEDANAHDEDEAAAAIASIAAATAVDTTSWNGSPTSSPTPLPPLSPSSAPPTPLSQRCDIITRLLRQGPFQQGIAHASMAVAQAIACRKDQVNEQSGEHLTEEELRLMEMAYCATWARTVMERRNGIHAMEPFLSSVIQLAVLMVEQDRTIPETYAQTVQALFHHGDHDGFRRTRRTPRILQAERMSYEDTMSAYGYEDQELAHAQRDFQLLFQQLGGMEACLTAMESHLDGEERWDIKLHQLLSLLTLCSKIQLQGDSHRSRATLVAEYSNRLTSIVLKYFPDQVDVLNVVDKAVVFDIVGQVSDFLLGNHRTRSHSYESLEGSDDEDDDEEMTGPPDYHHPHSHHHHRRHSMNEVRAQIRVADFRLEMAARMMKCSRLDMRLAGLSELKEVLSPVLNRMQQQQHQQPRARVRRRSDGEAFGSPELDKKSIENMCARLHDLKIIGYIFGPNIHLEIVQRSSEVLSFMLQTNSFSLADLDIIWAASGGNQHRSIVYGVYQVLSDLSDRLPLDYLLHLFQQLQAAPLEQWDQQLVDLARALFQAVLQRAHQVKDNQSATLVPYLTLFNVLRRSAAQQRSKDDPVFSPAQPIANAVVLSISSLLNEGLRLPLSTADCRSLMDICINDLKTHHPGTVWSLQVIQALFDFQAQTEEGLAFMNKVSPILPDLFISDFQAFAENMKKAATLSSPTISTFSSVSNYACSQEQQRTMQLKARLDFLESMTKRVPELWASTTIADKLWESLIVEPINAYDRDLTFRCLETITDHAFALYIFENLLPRLDVRDLSEAAWSCIRQYFLQLNWNLKSLIVDVDQATGIHSYIVVQPLIGLDSIWSIALGARQPAVGIVATEFLNTLVKLPETKLNLPEGLPSFRQDLVRTCVEHLFDAADKLGASNEDDLTESDQPLRFERCINILKAFLATCDAQTRDQSGWPRIHGALDEDNMLMLKFSTSSPSITVPLSIHPSETLLNLKRQVAQRLNAPSVNSIRLFTMGRDISSQHNNKTLEDLRVTNGQHFMVQLLRQQSMSMDTIEDAMTESPTDLLLQEDVYSRILQCLHLNERFASQAWEIVVCLPTSPRLLQDLVELQEPMDWASFLEARSPFMLLYSLQIINALVRKDLALETPQQREWTARFIARGGLASLTSVIMSDSGLGVAHRTGQTEKKTLGLMLKVLVRLTQTATELPAVSMEGQGSELLGKLVQEILRSASVEGGLEREDQAIVLNATSLVSSFCSGPKGWEAFQQLEDIPALVRVALVQSNSLEIRQAFVDMCSQFCSRNLSMGAETDPRIFFLNILVSLLPIPEEHVSNCSELFEFLGSIVRNVASTTTTDFYRSLYTKIVQLLLSHRSIENRPDQEDSVLIGLLRVGTVMLDTEKQLKTESITAKAVDHVFDECLFAQEQSPSSSPTIVETRISQCQSTASRTAALAFLEECATGSVSILQHIMSKLYSQYHRDSDDALADEWAYNPKDIMRASCGFVGLQNLGATCYMNSLLQQFFMNRAFRDGLLNAPTSVTDDSDDKYESILYQLQVMMGNLQESHRRSFNAFGFCYSYKDWDGNPTNVAVQMDVDEFFSILFDRLESQLKGTPQEQLLKNVYGGKLVQQIKSKDCEHISEREDSFFSIQCEVKNKRSVEESLELYVQGEILDGDNKYKCSGCDKHVDAIKRACIKELPQNLVLHLKRFDYDMDTMSRIKINDRFEFPTVLDMEPYTLDYLTRKEQAQEAAGSGAGGAPTTPVEANPTEPSKYEYNLVGVLVHTGTADSGHYYSYIKDRSPRSGGSGGSDRSGSWLHFNDSTVEEFDPSEIPAKAFGGTDYLPTETSPYHQHHKSPARSVPKCYSAYMLFYERATASPLLSTTAEGEPHSQSGKSYVPRDILEGVRRANAKLLRDVATFDPLYYRFVWDLFHMHQLPTHSAMSPSPLGTERDEWSLTSPTSMSMSMRRATQEFAQSLVPMERLHLERLSLRYGLDFFFSVLIHARDTEKELRQWTAFLAELMGQDPQGCVELMDWLTRDTQLLENALIGCKVPYVRQAVAQLVLACLGHLRRTEPAQYGLREVESRSASTPLSAAAAEAGADGEETETTREPMVETRTICEEGTPIYQLVEMLGGLLGEARKYWQHFDEYFSLLHNIALLGQEERAMMVQQGLLTQLIEFFIGDDRHDSKKKKMMDKFSKPSFHYVLLTIQALLLTCDVIRSMELITGAAVNARAAAASHLRRSSTASNQSTSSSASPEESAAGHSMSDTDSSVTDGRVVFTSADLAAMIYVPPATMGKERAPVFFAKMIQDRTETEIVATISRHLSAHGPLGQRVLEYVSACMDHMNEEQVPTVLQIYKELIQIEDEQTEMRSEVILQRTVKVLSLSSSPATAFDCLEFLRAISDFGQCGRWVQHWLLANKSAWVQEMLVVHGDQETRAQTQQFLKELLSSERVFHPEWSEAQVAEAMARHFHDVLECMRIIPSILPYYQHQQQQRSPTSPSSPVEDEGLWRFVEYFQTLSEMVVSDRERALFNPCWPTFIECLLQVDARHLTLDYDKKEMMILWGKLMNDDASRNLKLSQFKQIGQLLRHYFVCLQPNPQNVSFHWETLPIYFDLVWRFCQVSPQFHLEWAQCHNYKWAIGAMIWGTFREHCPEVLPRLLRFTLTEFPVYREECWKSLPAPSTPHFATSFVLLARAMFAPHNEMAGRLFYRNNGLTWLTKIMKLADTAGNVLDPKEFYAVEALSVLHDYLIKIPECLSKPYFAEAFDHWQNLEDAIMLLTGNLMWNIERSVYEQSVAIVHQIVRVGSPTQSAPIVAALDGAHVEWRNRYDAGLYGPPQIYELFGGTLSPFYRSGALAGPEITPGVNFPPVRLGPSVFVPTVLVQSKMMKTTTTERRKKRRSEEDVEEGEQETALETVLRQWYEPYWALVKDACKLDGTKELNSKSVELAALVSMEQISIGQSSMLSVLCDAARLAKTDSDLQLALQNPYVTLLMERLVGLDGRSSEEKATASSAAQDGGVAQDGEAKEEGDDSEPVLRGLSESLLAQCDDLVRATIENLDRQALVEIVEQATDQAHQALARIVQQHEASAKEGKGMEEVEESTVLASTESERAMVVRSESRRLAKALRVLRLLSAASTIVMDEAAVTKWQQLMFSVLNHLQELSAESRTVIVPILNSSGPVPPCSTATTTQSQATGRRSGEDVQQQQQQHGRGASEGSLNAMTERENSRMEDGESGTEMEALEVGHASVPENRNEGGGGSTGGSDGSNEDEEDEDERRARMMSLEKEDDS